MAKKAEDRTFNISVIGLSGTEKEKGVVGIGKSCLCNRFIYSVADKYYRDHISVLSQSDFAGRVINNDHFLYWGEVTKLDEGNHFTFHVIEQSEFIDDVSFQPFKTGRDPYVKRSVGTKVQSAEKLMYICKDQLGMETDSAYEQKLMPDGKLNIDGYICCFDVSRVEQRSLEHQVDFVSHLLTGAIKTKKPVVLVTTKNDEADERYVKEAEKLASRRENKTNIPLIGTSAHENVNVEQAFMVLAHMIDKSKTRPKITAVHEAFKQRREILDVATEAYKSLLRTNVQDPKATWNMARKKLEKESDFGHYVDLFGSDSAKKLFRQHTKYLRDEQIRMREQHFIKRLPDVLQHFLPDLPTIADRAWTGCQRYILQHADFDQYFVNICEEGESWKMTDDFLDNYQETRLPYDLLSSSEAETCFRNHLNALQAENRKLELKKNFKKLLEENHQVTPGKPLDDTYIFFVGKECYNDLKPYEREQVYKEHQRELESLAKHEFQELLWEKSEVFIRMLHTTDIYKTEDIKEIEHCMDTDVRYRRLDRLEEDRKLMLYKHLGFMECPDSSKCYFQTKCAEALIQEAFAARPVSRPESQQPEVPEVTEKTIKPLNLVLLGNEGLATEFYKEIRNIDNFQDEFHFGDTIYSLDYRPIEEDVSRDYNAFATANFQPHGCLCVYSSHQSFEYVQSSLETTLLTDLRRDDNVPTLQSLPIVIIHAFNHQASEKEQYILSEYGQTLAKRLQCAFIDIPRDEYVMDHSKFSRVQIKDALSALVSGSRYGTHSRSWSEDLEPDLRIGMCIMCGDPFPVDVPLGPLFNSNPTNVDDSHLFITLETNLDNNPDFAKQKIEVSIGSYHSFVSKIFKPTEEEEDLLYHGFILVFSTKRKASFCIMKAFAEALRTQMSIMPILILAVTDASVGAAIFFTDEFSQNMISEGNKVADTLGAEFKMTTANFQQQAPIYIPFLKEAWLKHDEITESFYCEPSSPPAYDEHIDRRPPAPLPNQFDPYQTTKSSTSNSQSTEDSEPIYDQPHRPLLSDSEHERPSSTSPPPFSSGHHHHHHPPPSRGEHYNANDTRHSELLVKPSMIKKRQGTNADCHQHQHHHHHHKEQYRKSYPAIEADIVKLQSAMSMEHTDIDREPHYQVRKSCSMKLGKAVKEEEEAWALNESRRAKKGSTFPSDGRQNSKDNGSWSEQSRHASTGSRDSEEIVWEQNELYSTSSTFRPSTNQRKSHLYGSSRPKSKGSIQAPLAIPEPIEIAADYATVQDFITDENDYDTVNDALPEGHLQRIKSTSSRKKDKDGTEDSEDSEFSSLERDRKDPYARVNRKPTPHKKRTKQKSHDGQVFSVFSDDKHVTGRHLSIGREHPDRERSNSPSEGSEGTSDEVQLVPKGKKRSFRKKAKWRSHGSESSSHGTFSPQLSDENLLGSPTSHMYEPVHEKFGTITGTTWSMTSSVDGEVVDLNDSGNWKDKKYQKDTLRKQKKEEKRIMDAEKRRQKEEERRQREQQKQQKKTTKKSRSSGTSEGGIRLAECSMSSNNPSLPQFIETCVEYIEAEGMNTEGIYRIPGNKAQVDLLQNKFQEDPNLDILSLEIQVNAVATVLKTFLKESEPLIPFSLHDELLEAAGMPDKSIRLLALRGVLQKLHPLNWEVLKYFITHLNRVSKQKENHNMDSRNLALCLWPTIIRIDFSSYDKMAQGTRIPPEIVQTLIDQYGFFFHGENEV